MTTATLGLGSEPWLSPCVGPIVPGSPVDHRMVLQLTGDPEKRPSFTGWWFQKKHESAGSIISASDNWEWPPPKTNRDKPSSGGLLPEGMGQKKQAPVRRPPSFPNQECQACERSDRRLAQCHPPAAGEPAAAPILGLLATQKPHTSSQRPANPPSTRLVPPTPSPTPPPPLPARPGAWRLCSEPTPHKPIQWMRVCCPSKPRSGPRPRLTGRRVRCEEDAYASCDRGCS